MLPYARFMETVFFLRNILSASWLWHLVYAHKSSVCYLTVIHALSDSDCNILNKEDHTGLINSIVIKKKEKVKCEKENIYIGGNYSVLYLYSTF